MTYNPRILPEMLRSRSISHRRLSQRLKLDIADLEREIQREPEPKQSILKSIARELAVPPFVFYMERAPALHDVIPDFRSDKPSPSVKRRETTESIQFAEGIQRAAGRFFADTVDELPNLPEKSTKVNEIAFRVREMLSISVDDQIGAKDARAFYLICRKKIEDKGIFVFHESFPETDGSGFCLADPNHPVIVVNTRKQTPGRRLFTLVHELAHVLMGSTGISDPSIKKNAVEKTCNRFAASFLVPKEYLPKLLGNRTLTADPSLNDVSRIARRLKISQEATVVRLEELGEFRIGSHAKWLREIKTVGNPDFVLKKPGGPAGGPPPQEKVKLAKYGFHFAKEFGPMLANGLITEINLFRTSGLKPAYQRAYFDFARSLSQQDLHSLELDDD